MDTVDVRQYRTRYAASEHPMIFVNGCALDEWLVERAGNDHLLGLVPAVTWLWNDDEHRLASARFASEREGSTFTPLLVCPDDADFSCTVLIVEIERSARSIKWSRFGIDASEGACVGSTVRWFDFSIELEFEKAAYDSFRKNLLCSGTRG